MDTTYNAPKLCDNEGCEHHGALHVHVEPQMALWYREEDDSYKVAKVEFNLHSRDVDALYNDVTKDSKHVARHLSKTICVDPKTVQQLVGLCDKIHQALICHPKLKTIEDCVPILNPLEDMHRMVYQILNKGK